MNVGNISQKSGVALFGSQDWQLVERKTVGLNEGIDGNDKLLIHFDGSDGATTYTAETGQTVTFAGTAQLDTAQKKFGTASLLLDGNSDYVTLPDSADWDFGAGDFTIDCWVRFNTSTTSQTIISQWQDDNNEWYFQASTGSDLLIFQQIVGGVYEANYYCSFTPSDNTWYHLVLVRNGSTCLMFINGVSQSVTIGTAWGTLTALSGLLQIGNLQQTAARVNYFDGWIDEVRISKGVAKWTANFTPPTSAYGVTSYTFSGLTGDSETEYRLICYGVAGAVNTEYGIQINADTGSKYGYQIMYGQNTTAAASRNATTMGLITTGTAASGKISFSDIIISAKTGTVRPSICKYVHNIDGTTVDLCGNIGGSYNDTATEITSIKVLGSGANMLGIGTDLFLFARRLGGTEATSGQRFGTMNVKGTLSAGCFVLKERYEVTGSAATSKTFSGLTGDTNPIYIVKARIISGYASDNNYSIALNGDTTTYGIQDLYGTDTTVSAYRGTSGNGMATIAACAAANRVCMIDGLIYAKSGNVRTGIFDIGRNITGTTVGFICIEGNSYDETATEITSIVFNGDQTGCYNVGTVIELYQLQLGT